MHVRMINPDSNFHCPNTFCNKNVSFVQIKPDNTRYDTKKLLKHDKKHNMNNNMNTTQIYEYVKII